MPTRRGVGAAVTAALVIALSLIAFPAKATRTQQLSLEEMAQRADRVFSGRCLDLEVAEDPVLRQTVTHVTFAVQRGAKGTAEGRLTIKLLGDQRRSSDRGRGVAGVPTFSVGEEVILFLYKNSSQGMTSPVGFVQGKFSILEDGKGNRKAVNGLGNKNLFRGLSESAERLLGREPDRWRGRDGIPPDVLLDMVSSLSR